MAASDSSARRAELLALFEDGHISSDELRTSLAKLSGDSKTGGVEPSSPASADTGSDPHGDQPTVAERPVLGLAPRKGDVLAGKFELEEQIGRGAMGVVWKAHDSLGKRTVCVKLLPPEVQHDPLELERLQELFGKIHILQHEHLCPLYGLEHDARFRHFLTMKFIDGVTLAEYRRDYVKTHGTFPLEETVRLLGMVARCLDYIHSERVVHRDLKPANILVSRDGRKVQIIDLGLAAEIRSTVSRVSRKSADLAGTAPYMAPEQWEGEVVDGKADQFALATIAYELLAGRLPFDCPSDTAWMHCALNKQAPEAEGLAPVVLEGLRKARHRLRDSRFATCSELLRTLQNPSTELDQPKTLPDAAASNSAIIVSASKAALADGTPTRGATETRPVESSPPRRDPAKVSGRATWKRTGEIVEVIRFSRDHSRIQIPGKDGTLLVPTKELHPHPKIGRDDNRLDDDRAKAVDHSFNADASPRTAVPATAMVTPSDGGRLLTVPSHEWPTITAAMLEAQEGDTIRVRPGVYEETVEFKSGVVLSGDDREKCIVRLVPGRAYALKAEGAASGVVTQLTFDSGEGVLAGPAAEPRRPASGLILSNSRIRMKSCNVWGFSDSGILVTGNASLAAISDNVCRDNARNGIAFVHGARGAARNNHCADNLLSGCFVADSTTTARLTANVCESNLYGIRVCGGASAKAEQNECRNNGDTGISAADRHTELQVIANSCEGNRVHGIFFAHETRGVVRENTCRDNAECGISLCDEAMRGFCRDNICEGNRVSISVLEVAAKPVAVSPESVRSRLTPQQHAMVANLLNEFTRKLEIHTFSMVAAGVVIFLCSLFASVFITRDAPIAMCVMIATTFSGTILVGRAFRPSILRLRKQIIDTARFKCRISTSELDRAIERNFPLVWKRWKSWA